MDKPKTIIVDVDGVIFKHAPWDETPILLDGVKEAFREWERKCYRIVIMTARPECLRGYLESVLESRGLFWHALVMDVTSGPRVLINDAKPDRDVTAIGVTIPRDTGLEEIDSKIQKGFEIC